MRERIAARKDKKKVAEEATKSTISKGKASKAMTKAITNDDGRTLTKISVWTKPCMIVWAT